MDENIKKDFFQRVYDLVKQIPYGKVTTYGAIGKALGMASSARMVGWALNSAMEKKDIPAHRVVNRLGELSGSRYFATPTLMRELLESEGIKFIDTAVDMEVYFWDPSNEL